ncbi:MAG: T9SS type A sorting domain-containing protein, partial [Saprospiraceae bacterium]|nr:T9SS type A sorting domain-containing protein [Saprospiraceae bacterium]
AAILDPSWNSTGANGPIYAPIDVEPTSQSTFDNWYTSPGATQIAGIYMGVSVNDFYPSPVADGLGILWIECHLVGTSCPTLMPMTISNNINLQNTPTDQLSQQNSDNAALHSDKQRSRLFPNPASELLHISLSQNQSQAVDYRLLSANGQLLSRGTLRSDVLDVSHLPQGSYFLHLATEQDNWMEKFIIQR